VQAGVREVRAGVLPDRRVRVVGRWKRCSRVSSRRWTRLWHRRRGAIPMSPLPWTTKSLVRLPKRLSGKGFRVSKTTVGPLLKQAGYRLPSVFKTKEGPSHPDRDAQFGQINTLGRGSWPAGTGDQRGHEGEGAGGRVRQRRPGSQPAGTPVEVNGYDIPSGVPKAIPYGVYGLAADDGFVSVGVDHHTAASISYGICIVDSRSTSLTGATGKGRP
jgi:Rhodopirellula transposase DDE domain